MRAKKPSKKKTFRRRAIKKRTLNKRINPPTRQAKETNVKETHNSRPIDVRALDVNFVEFALSTSQPFANARDNLVQVLRGISIERTFFYNDIVPPINQVPMMCHYALCQLKQPYQLLSSNPALVAFIRERFFRNQEDTTSDTRNFDNPGILSSYELGYNTNPMNPEKLNILTHSKRVIYPPSSESTPHGKDKWTIKRYFKFSQKIKFDQMDSVIPTCPFIEITWYQPHLIKDWQIGTTYLNKQISIQFANKAITSEE